MTPEELEKWKAENEEWRKKAMEQVQAERGQEPVDVVAPPRPAWYQKKLEYDRKWRAEHPNYVKEWRAKNPEKARASAKRAYLRRVAKRREELRHCPGCRCSGRKRP